MKISKIYILLAIAYLVYAQTDSLIWINKYDRKLINKTDKELLQLQNDYISSEKTKTTREILYRAKVNINRIQEFKKLGIEVDLETNEIERIKQLFEEIKSDA